MDFYNWPNKVEGDLNALDFYIVILECTFNVVCHVVYYYTTEFCLKRALCSSSQKMILWRGKKIKLEWNNWRLLLNRVFTSLYAVHEALFCTMFGSGSIPLHWIRNTLDYKSIVGPIFGLFYVNSFTTKPSVNGYV